MEVQRKRIDEFIESNNLLLGEVPFSQEIGFWMDSNEIS